MKHIDKQNNVAIRTWWFIPIILLLTLIPLISVIHYYDSGLGSYPWYPGDGMDNDIFNYYRGISIQIVGGVILVLISILIPNKRFGFIKERRSIPPILSMSVFAILSVLSSVFSKHVSVSFLGGAKLFEGCLILLSYSICFFFAFGYARTEKLIRFLLDALLIGAFIMGILGTLQAFGWDWLGSDLFKPILSLERAKYIDISDIHVDLTFDGQNRGYGTLYNPNYTGSYVALMLPYTVYVVIYGKMLWRKILSCITTVMLLIMLYSSKSLTGVLGVIGAGIIAVLIIIPLLKKRSRNIVIIIGVFTIMIIGLILTKQGLLNKFFSNDEKNSVMNIESIKTNKNTIRLNLKDKRAIILSLDTNALSDPQWFLTYSAKEIINITDASDNQVLTSYVDGENEIDLESGWPKNLSFKLEATDVSGLGIPDSFYGMGGVIRVIDFDHEWPFLYTNGEFYHINVHDKLDKMRKIEKFGFERNYDFASSRGYIWSRTIPLLKFNMLIGSGPDNFIYEFPNDDYIGLEYAGFGGLIINKPHNMYLQIWVQEGFIALVAFVLLYVMFIVRVINLAIKYNRLVTFISNNEISKPDDIIVVDSDTKFFLTFIITTAIAATGFMVTGLANDSTIGVTPIYWTMLGVGYAAESVAYKKYNKGGLCRNEKKIQKK